MARKCFPCLLKKVYIYDATGVKQRKTVSTGATTDYAGNYVYENNTLQFFNTTEGYVVPTGDVIKPFQYVYQYKDHLGNIRLSYKDISTTNTPILQIQEENNYYPFGLKHKGYNNNVVSEHPYKYNGKELNEELGLDWYDYGARNYDASLGRWMNVDPMAHLREWVSPYNFVQNNPINRIDPTGALDDDITAKQDGTIKVKKTDDKFDRFFVENNDGSKTQVAQLDKVKSFDGKTDLVKFPESGKGFTRYGDEEAGGDRYVQPVVAAALFGAINEFNSDNSEVTIQLGNMSAADGSQPGKGVHKEGSMSHVNGTNVDLRYIRKDGALSPVTVFDSQFDRTSNQSMVNSFNKFGFKSILSYPSKDGFLLNNTKNIDTKLYKNPKHHNHLHMQGFSPKLKVIK